MTGKRHSWISICSGTVLHFNEQYYPEALTISAGAVFVGEGCPNVVFENCSFTKNFSKT
jgi:hypothetical protein